MSCGARCLGPSPGHCTTFKDHCREQRGPIGVRKDNQRVSRYTGPICAARCSGSKSVLAEADPPARAMQSIAEREHVICPREEH